MEKLENLSMVDSSTIPDRPLSPILTSNRTNRNIIAYNRRKCRSRVNLQKKFRSKSESSTTEVEEKATSSFEAALTAAERIKRLEQIERERLHYYNILATSTEQNNFAGKRNTFNKDEFEFKKPISPVSNLKFKKFKKDNEGNDCNNISDDTSNGVFTYCSNAGGDLKDKLNDCIEDLDVSDSQLNRIVDEVDENLKINCNELEGQENTSKSNKTKEHKPVSPVSNLKFKKFKKDEGNDCNNISDDTSRGVFTCCSNAGGDLKDKLNDCIEDLYVSDSQLNRIVDEVDENLKINFNELEGQENTSISNKTKEHKPISPVSNLKFKNFKKDNEGNDCNNISDDTSSGVFTYCSNAGGDLKYKLNDCIEDLYVSDSQLNKIVDEVDENLKINFNELEEQENISKSNKTKEHNTDENIVNQKTEDIFFGFTQGEFLHSLRQERLIKRTIKVLEGKISESSCQKQDQNMTHCPNCQAKCVEESSDLDKLQNPGMSKKTCKKCLLYQNSKFSSNEERTKGKRKRRTGEEVEKYDYHDHRTERKVFWDGREGSWGNFGEDVNSGTWVEDKEDLYGLNTRWGKEIHFKNKNWDRKKSRDKKVSQDKTAKPIRDNYEEELMDAKICFRAEVINNGPWTRCEAWDKDEHWDKSNLSLGVSGSTLVNTASTFGQSRSIFGQTGSTFDKSESSFDKTGSTFNKTGSTFNKTRSSVDNTESYPNTSTFQENDLYDRGEGWNKTENFWKKNTDSFGITQFWNGSEVWNNNEVWQRDEALDELRQANKKLKVENTASNLPIKCIEKENRIEIALNSSISINITCSADKQIVTNSDCPIFSEKTLVEDPIVKITKVEHSLLQSHQKLGAMRTLIHEEDDLPERDMHFDVNVTKKGTNLKLDQDVNFDNNLKFEKEPKPTKKSMKFQRSEVIHRHPLKVESPKPIKSLIPDKHSSPRHKESDEITYIKHESPRHKHVECSSPRRKHVDNDSPTHRNVDYISPGRKHVSYSSPIHRNVDFSKRIEFDSSRQKHNEYERTRHKDPEHNKSSPKSVPVCNLQPFIHPLQSTIAKDRKKHQGKELTSKTSTSLENKRQSDSSRDTGKSTSEGTLYVGFSTGKGQQILVSEKALKIAKRNYKHSEKQELEKRKVQKQGIKKLDSNPGKLMQMSGKALDKARNIISDMKECLDNFISDKISTPSTSTKDSPIQRSSEATSSSDFLSRNNESPVKNNSEKHECFNRDEHSKDDHSKSIYSKSQVMKAERFRNEQLNDEEVKNEHLKGTYRKGEHLKHAHTNDEHSKGEYSKGEHSKGEHSKSVNSKGDRSKDYHSKDDHSKGDHAKGDHMKGDRSRGEHSKGDVSKSHISKCEHSEIEEFNFHSNSGGFWQNCAFKTSSGKSIAVSRKNLQSAKSRQKDCAVDDLKPLEVKPSKIPDDILDKALDIYEQIKDYHKTDDYLKNAIILNKAISFFDSSEPSEPNLISGGGFKTAGGKSIKTNSESIKKAKERYDKTLSDNEMPQKSKLNLKSKFNSPLKLKQDTSDDSDATITCKDDRNTASNKKIMFDQKSVNKAREMHPNKEENKNLKQARYLSSSPTKGRCSKNDTSPTKERTSKEKNLKSSDKPSNSTDKSWKNKSLKTNPNDKHSRNPKYERVTISEQTTISEKTLIAQKSDEERSTTPEMISTEESDFNRKDTTSTASSSASKNSLLFNKISKVLEATPPKLYCHKNNTFNTSKSSKKTLGNSACKQFDISQEKLELAKTILDGVQQFGKTSPKVSYKTPSKNSVHIYNSTPIRNVNPSLPSAAPLATCSLIDSTLTPIKPKRNHLNNHNYNNNNKNMKSDIDAMGDSVIVLQGDKIEIREPKAELDKEYQKLKKKMNVICARWDALDRQIKKLEDKGDQFKR